MTDAQKVRCPDCGRLVNSIFDHVDRDCASWPREEAAPTDINLTARRELEVLIEALGKSALAIKEERDQLKTQIETMAQIANIRERQFGETRLQRKELLEVLEAAVAQEGHKSPEGAVGTVWWLPQARAAIARARSGI